MGGGRAPARAPPPFLAAAPSKAATAGIGARAHSGHFELAPSRQLAALWVQLAHPHARGDDVDRECQRAHAEMAQDGGRALVSDLCARLANAIDFQRDMGGWVSALADGYRNDTRAQVATAASLAGRERQVRKERERDLDEARTAVSELTSQREADLDKARAALAALRADNEALISHVRELEARLADGHADMWRTRVSQLTEMSRAESALHERDIAQMATRNERLQKAYRAEMSAHEETKRELLGAKIAEAKAAAEAERLEKKLLAATNAAPFVGLNSASVMAGAAHSAAHAPGATPTGSNVASAGWQHDAHAQRGGSPSAGGARAARAPRPAARPRTAGHAPPHATPSPLKPARAAGVPAVDVQYTQRSDTTATATPVRRSVSSAPTIRASTVGAHAAPAGAHGHALSRRAGVEEEPARLADGPGGARPSTARAGAQGAAAGAARQPHLRPPPAGAGRVANLERNLNSRFSRLTRDLDAAAPGDAAAGGATTEAPVLTQASAMRQSVPSPGSSMRRARGGGFTPSVTYAEDTALSPAAREGESGSGRAKRSSWRQTQESTPGWGSPPASPEPSRAASPSPHAMGGVRSNPACRSAVDASATPVAPSPSGSAPAASAQGGMPLRRAQSAAPPARASNAFAGLTTTDNTALRRAHERALEQVAALQAQLDDERFECRRLAGVQRVLQAEVDELRESRAQFVTKYRQASEGMRMAAGQAVAYASLQPAVPNKAPGTSARAAPLQAASPTPQADTAGAAPTPMGGTTLRRSVS